MPRRPPPPHASIADAQRDVVATLDVVPDAAARTCWACGAASEPGESVGWLQRAHVVAHAAGGSNDPGNFLLLCAVCHREHPDAAPREEQLAWLRAHESQVSRILREFVGPLTTAPRGVAREEAGATSDATADGAVAAWWQELGASNEERGRAVHALCARFANAPGGCTTGNGVASALWGLVSEFRGWLRGALRKAA